MVLDDEEEFACLSTAWQTLVIPDMRPRRVRHCTIIIWMIDLHYDIINESASFERTSGTCVSELPNRDFIWSFCLSWARLESGNTPMLISRGLMSNSETSNLGPRIKNTLRTCDRLFCLSLLESEEPCDFAINCDLSLLALLYQNETRIWTTMTTYSRLWLFFTDMPGMGQVTTTHTADWDDSSALVQTC